MTSIIQRICLYAVRYCPCCHIVLAQMLLLTFCFCLDFWYC